MLYGVFESTNMKSTRGAERILDAVATTDIENGTFGYLGDLVDGEGVVYEFHPGCEDGQPIVVADQPAWTTDNRRIESQRKDKFIIEAGTPFRVRIIASHDEFAINDKCVKGNTQNELKPGAYLTIDNTTGKLIASATSTPGVPMEAKVLRTRISGAALVTPIRDYGHARTMYEARVITLE